MRGARRRDLCGELQLVQRERGVVVCLFVCLGMYGDDKKGLDMLCVPLYKQKRKEKRT